MAGEPTDPLLNNLCAALFLAAEADSEIHCPVVTLQQDPANVYALLEQYLRPEALPHADRFWRNVRLLPAGFSVWRPRVNGIQLKMLQHARLPRSEAEWAMVEAALGQLSDALQPGKTAEELLKDLRAFCMSVEAWWAGRRRSEGLGSKRPSQGGQQGGGKRAALDALHPALLASTQALQLAFPPPPALASSFPLGMPPYQYDPNDPGAGFAAMEAQLTQAASAAALAELANGPARSAAAGGGSGRLIVLNVGGQRFSTSPATLGAVSDSYFAKLAEKAAATNKAEFFIDRPGEQFHVVLGHLRSQRYGHAPVALPADAGALQLVHQEASYYLLPQLCVEVAAALAAASRPPAGEELSAVYLSTGFSDEGALNDAHADLLRRLNAALAAKQAEGYAVAKRDCGTEREGTTRNLYYHCLLFCPLPS